MTLAAESGSVRAGGAALVIAALGFTAVFLFLAIRFDYPDVLDAPAMTALPALLEMGGAGRAVWALYGLLPLLLIPAAVGASCALREQQEGLMRTAVLFALVAALTMMLGLLRWPSVQWELAKAWVAAAADERVVLSALFDGLNRYLGTYLGEFVGELSLNAFFILSGAAMWRGTAFPRWLAMLGIAAGVLGWIAMWRNVTGLVAPAAALNNALLPIWLLTFGIALVRLSRPRKARDVRKPAQVPGYSSAPS
jgi:Domain of unknown function (DUF4386)